MRKSKYLNKTFGNWTCTHVGIATVQGKKAKWAGHRGYYYIFGRKTSDGKAYKTVRLNSSEAARVYKGLSSVEAIADKRFSSGTIQYINKASYQFLSN